MLRTHFIRLLLVAGLSVLAWRCGRSNNPIMDPPPPPILPPATFIGAGDIAQCDNDGGRPSEATARLLDRFPEATVFTAGDNAYFHGSAADFANCYEPRWGRHKRRTRPSPGNHEYESPGAVPYFNYFGANAGDFGLGYYSYNLGAWHIVSLNSNVGISAGHEQYVWLQDDLAANARTPCTLAYFHHPRFSSGPSGPLGVLMTDVWRLMYGAGVDVVVNGHDHGYERFEPQDFNGTLNLTGGIREFIVGTGGASLYIFGRAPNSAIRISSYGVLKFVLRGGGYDWEFLQAGTAATLDPGSGTCH